MDGWTNSDIITGAVLASVGFFWFLGLPWYAAIPVGAIAALPMLMFVWFIFVVLSALVGRICEVFQ